LDYKRPKFGFESLRRVFCEIELVRCLLEGLCFSNSPRFKKDIVLDTPVTVPSVASAKPVTRMVLVRSLRILLNDPGSALTRQLFQSIFGYKEKTCFPKTTRQRALFLMVAQTFRAAR
jgi:hypothetical protein